jgi:AraC-like DNA-binding protein
VLKIDSISYLCELLGCEKPKHPLIIATKNSSVKTVESFQNTDYVPGFYVIALKHGTDCEMKYGRHYYDFSEGSLVFSSPGQLISAGDIKQTEEQNSDGWMLCFHQDLLKGTSLWNKMPDYHFFEYETYEALHLSDVEKDTIERTVENIKVEYSQNIDPYSRDLLIANLEVLLNYANRFYNRQFITRTVANKEAITKFESLLEKRCSVEVVEQQGQPRVKELADSIGYSPNYLSDMLKRETGKTTKEHISLRIAQHAEYLLMKTDEPVYRIAQKLGFEQPASFTKFIKSQYGVSPMNMRKRA